MRPAHHTPITDAETNHALRLLKSYPSGLTRADLERYFRSDRRGRQIMAALTERGIAPVITTDSRLGRTPGSVKGRVARLGLTKPKPPPPAPRKRNDRDLNYSLIDRAPEGTDHLGRKRDYGRVQTLGEPCPKHPSYTVGFFGCAACVTGARWAARQRETKARPSHEGGR